MPSVMRLGIFFCVFLISLAGCSSKQDNVSILQDELFQLEQAKLLHDYAGVPKQWISGLFLSNVDLTEFLSVLDNAEVASSDDSAVSLRVVGVRVEGRTGGPHAIIKIDAVRGKLEAGLEIDAAVQFQRTELRGNDNEAFAILGLRLVSIRPRGLLSYVPFMDRDLVNDPKVQQVVRTLLSKFDEAVPTIHELRLPMEYSDTQTVSTNDGKGSFELKVSSPPSKIIVPWSAGVPLSTSQGIWILAAAGKKPLPTFDRAQLSKSPEALQARIRALHKLLADKEAAIPETFKSSGVWISAAVFGQIAEQFNALPDAQRRVNANVESINGDIVKKVDGPKGAEGGYRVTLKSGRAQLQLGKAAFNWSNGASLTFPLSVNVNASVDVHVDPYVSGGITKNADLAGKADQSTTIRVEPRLVTGSGGSALVVGPVFSCSYLPMTIEGGGELKFGARTQFKVFQKPGRGNILLRSYKVIEINLPKLAKSANMTWRGKDNGQRFILIKPSEPSSVDSGYWFPVSVTRQDQATQKVDPAKIRLFDDEIEAKWETETASQCPPKPVTKFLFGGQDFGPNNVIVKILKSFAEELSRHGANLEQAKDDVETVLKNPKKAPEVAKKVKERGKKEGQRLIDRFRKI